MDFGGCDPSMHPCSHTRRAKPYWYPLHPPHFAAFYPSGRRAPCHQSRDGGRYLSSTGVLPWDGAPPGAPAASAPSPRAASLGSPRHGGCSVAWCGSSPTPPAPPATPSPIKGPGSGCVGSRAPPTQQMGSVRRGSPRCVCLGQGSSPSNYSYRKHILKKKKNQKNRGGKNNPLPGTGAQGLAGVSRQAKRRRYRLCWQQPGEGGVFVDIKMQL